MLFKRRGTQPWKHIILPLRHGIHEFFNISLVKASHQAKPNINGTSDILALPQKRKTGIVVENLLKLSIVLHQKDYFTAVLLMI